MDWLNHGNLPISCLTTVAHFLTFSLLITSLLTLCGKKRIKATEETVDSSEMIDQLFERPFGGVTKVELVCIASCDEAAGGNDAKKRHVKNDFVPVLQLLPTSITNENYIEFAQQYGKVKHRPPPQIKTAKLAGPTDEGKHAVLQPNCRVFLVYANDPCRGADDDQDTADDSSAANGENIENKIDQVLAANETPQTNDVPQTNPTNQTPPIEHEEVVEREKTELERPVLT